MYPCGKFPLELVDQVIDELGKDYRKEQADAYAALHACSSVSKSWTTRSRGHMFRKVKIKGYEDKPTATPPASIMTYVKKLEVVYHDYHSLQAASIADVLQVFVTAPIERLQISGVILVDKRFCIQECIETHFATLQKVEFLSCSLCTGNISDIVLGHNRLKTLHIESCYVDEKPSSPEEHDVDPEPSELELCITGGGDPGVGSAHIFAMAAMLPHRFRKLDITHIVGGDGTTETTNELLRVNKDVLSSLCVRIWAGMSGTSSQVDIANSHSTTEYIGYDIRADELFSLEDCSNVSSLTLETGLSDFCAIRDSIFLLSTLDRAPPRQLKEIILEGYFTSLVDDEEGPLHAEVWEGDEDDDEGEELDERVNWREFDVVLAKLAKASIRMRGKRLTFVLVALKTRENEELMLTIRTRLPELLPRFNDLGLLHVHHRPDTPCRAVDDSPTCFDKPDCLAPESTSEVGFRRL